MGDDIREQGPRADEGASPPAIPGWVKLLAGALVVVALVFVLLHVAGFAPGPGGHVPVEIAPAP